MLISQRLERLASRYHDSRRSVALFLLENGERAQGMSMAAIAAETGTSKPTLVRIAKQMGYGGWREFFDDWRTEYNRQAQRGGGVDFSIPFSEGDDVGTVSKAIGQVLSESAWQTAQMQEDASLEKAASILLGARRIALFGISVNALCLQLFQRKLVQIGIDSILPQQAEMGLFARTLSSQDCVMMVSYSGESYHRSPMKYLPELNEKGVPVIALTSEGDNYLRDHANVVLSILAQESLYNKIGTFSTEASINTLLDIVYATVFARNYRRNLEFKSSSSRAVEVNRRAD